MVNFSFIQPSVTIAVNDSVTWTNNGSVQHTTKSDTGSAITWDSGPIGVGSNYSKTFVSTGTFPYHCQFHGNDGTGMHGTIFVVTSPTITSANTAHGSVNSKFTFAVTADQMPTSYAATGLPAGLTIDTSTGVISGIPTDSSGSPYSVTVTASNGVTTDGSDTLTITVDANPSGAPAITSSTAISGNVGTPLSYQIVATNLPTSYGSTTLPAGLTLSASGLIDGTPTTVGSTPVEITATNGSGTATTDIVISIAAAVGGGPGGGGSAAAGTATAGTSSGGGGCGMSGGSTALLLAVLLGLASRRRLHGDR
jgi:hypothetical protein